MANPHYVDGRARGTRGVAREVGARGRGARASGAGGGGGTRADGQEQPGARQGMGEKGTRGRHGDRRSPAPKHQQGSHKPWGRSLSQFSRDAGKWLVLSYAAIATKFFQLAYLMEIIRFFSIDEIPLDGILRVHTAIIQYSNNCLKNFVTIILQT